MRFVPSLIAQLFEETIFDATHPFAWGLTPPKIAQLIKIMGAHEPSERPGALELIDRFVDTKLTAGLETDERRVVKSACVVS